MNVLQLFFDETSGQDSLGARRPLTLNESRVEKLSAHHFMSGVAWGEYNGSDTHSDTSDTTLFVQAVNGWLWLSASWLEPLRLCPMEDPDKAHDVVACLNGRLFRLTRWLYELHTCANTSLEVNELLSLTQRFTGFALVLFDASFNLTGYALGNTLLTKAFQQTIQQGYAAGVPEDHQRRYRQNFGEHQEGFETLLKEPERDTSVWVVPFQTSRAKTYFLHVMLGRTQYHGLRALVQALADELRALLERRESMRNHAETSNFVAELLTSSFTEKQARQRMDFLGWQPATNYRVIRAESFGTSHPDSQLEAICHRLENLVPHLHTTLINHGIAGLLGEEQGERAGDLLFSRAVEELLAGEGMRLIASAPLDQVRFASAAHGDVQEALAVLWRDSERGVALPASQALAYDACKPRILADALLRTAEKHDVVPDSLKQVRAYDSQHHTEFERTLTTYFMQATNKAATCAALHIHRSTLEYRLSRLREHFDIDIHDETILAYFIVLALTNRS